MAYKTQSKGFAVKASRSAATGMPRELGNDSPKAIRVAAGPLPTTRKRFAVVTRNATPEDVRRAGKAGKAYARRLPVPMRSQQGYEVFASQVGIDL